MELSKRFDVGFEPQRIKAPPQGSNLFRISTVKTVSSISISLAAISSVSTCRNISLMNMPNWACTF